MHGRSEAEEPVLSDDVALIICADHRIRLGDQSFVADSGGYRALIAILGEWVRGPSRDSNRNWGVLFGPMRWSLPRLLPVLACAAMAAACSRDNDSAPAVATPSLAVSEAATIGGPLEMAYRFAVADDAPAFTEDYWVFVHFLDTDGELMWTDDHEPPTPTRQWTPGSTVEYPRTMFIPKFPYVGQTRIEIGLYSPTSGDRLPLAGETAGLRSYRVATFDMRLQSDNLLVVFRDGWHAVETPDDFAGPEWRWSNKDATLTFPNPKRDVRVYLQLDSNAAAFSEPQRVEVRTGTAVVDSFLMPAVEVELRRIQIPASQLGTAETVDLTISVDRTFVPASIPALKSDDIRELGVRVFWAFVQPS